MTNARQAYASYFPPTWTADINNGSETSESLTPIPQSQDAQRTPKMSGRNGPLPATASFIGPEHVLPSSLQGKYNTSYPPSWTLPPSSSTATIKGVSNSYSPGDSSSMPPMPPFQYSDNPLQMDLALLHAMRKPKTWSVKGHFGNDINDYQQRLLNDLWGLPAQGAKRPNSIAHDMWYDGPHDTPDRVSQNQRKPLAPEEFDDDIHANVVVHSRQGATKQSKASSSGWSGDGDLPYEGPKPSSNYSCCISQASERR